MVDKIINKLEEQREIVADRLLKIEEKKAEIEGSKLGENAKMFEEASQELGVDKDGKRIGFGLYQDLDIEKKKNSEVITKLESFKYWNETVGTGKPDEIYLIQVPGGEQLRVSYGNLNNFLRQINIYFSRLDCPFREDGSSNSFTSQQKRELIESILPIGTSLPVGVSGLAGSTVVPVDANNSAAANKQIVDWEIKESGVEGIVEPTPNSYEWFKRWWKFHQNFPKANFAFGKKEDFDIYPTLITFPLKQGKATSYQSYKDNYLIVAQKKNISLLDGYIFKQGSKDAELPFLLIHSPVKNVFNATPAPIDYSDYYTADLIYYLNCVFNQNTLNRNLLLQTNGNIISGAVSPQQYLLTPEAVRKDYEYSSLHLPYWTPNPGKESSRLFDDHIAHGIVGSTDYSGWNYFDLDSNDLPYSFAGKITPGILGMISVFDDIYNRSGVFKAFYNCEENIMTVPNFIGKGRTQFFSNSRLSGPKEGDLPSSYDFSRIADIENKIKKAEEKLAKGRAYQGLTNPKLEEITKEWEELITLQAEIEVKIERLTGNNLTEIRKQVAVYKKFLGADYIDSDGKWLKEKERKRWDYFLTFEKYYEKLKKLTTPTDEELAMYNRYKLLSGKVGRILGKVISFYDRRGEKTKKQFAEEFCKDESKKAEIRSLLEDLEELDRNIILNDDSRDLFNNLKKAEVGQDLRSYLDRILKGSPHDNKEKKDKLLKAWRANPPYGEEENFYKLFHKYSASVNFLLYLKEQLKITETTTIDWLAAKDEKEKVEEVIKVVLHYEIYQWAKLSNSERSGKSEKEKIEALEKFQEHINKFSKSEYAIDSFELSQNFVEISSDKLATLFNELRDSINKELGGIVGAAKVIEWSKSPFNSAEKVKAIITDAETKADKFKAFTGGKDAKKIIEDNSSKDASAIFIRFSIKELGLTEESIKQAKITDKAKLEEASKKFAHLTELDVITGPEKAIQTLITSQLGKLSSTPSAPSVTSPVVDEKGETTPTPAPSTTNGVKPEEETKWYAKFAYMAIWLPVLIAIGFGIWYFFLRNSEDKKEEENEK